MCWGGVEHTINVLAFNEVREPLHNILDILERGFVIGGWLFGVTI